MMGNNSNVVFQNTVNLLVAANDLVNTPNSKGTRGNSTANNKTPLRKHHRHHHDDDMDHDDTIDHAEEEMEEEVDEEEEEDSTTRCVCSDSNAYGFMLQCEDCGVWQHGQCVGVPNKRSTPRHYYCEMCRPDEHPYNGSSLIAQRGKTATYVAIHQSLINRVMGQISSTEVSTENTSSSKLDEEETSSQINKRKRKTDSMEMNGETSPATKKRSTEGEDQQLMSHDTTTSGSHQHIIETTVSESILTEHDIKVEVVKRANSQGDMDTAEEPEMNNFNNNATTNSSSVKDRKRPNTKRVSGKAPLYPPALFAATSQESLTTSSSIVSTLPQPSAVSLPMNLTTLANSANLPLQSSSSQSLPSTNLSTTFLPWRNSTSSINQNLDDPTTSSQALYPHQTIHHILTGKLSSSTPSLPLPTTATEEPPSTFLQSSQSLEKQYTTFLSTDFRAEKYPAVRLRLPTTKTTMHEMNRRVSQLLQYLTKVQDQIRVDKERGVWKDENMDSETSATCLADRLCEGLIGFKEKYGPKHL